MQECERKVEELEVKLADDLEHAKKMMEAEQQDFILKLEAKQINNNEEMKQHLRDEMIE